MVAGGLIIQHHIVRARNAHKIIAARCGQKHQKIVRGILIGRRVIRVADIAAHRQSQQLAHEMIFQAGANDLPLVVKIFRPDKSHDAVHEERMEHAGHAIGARFERKLIDSVMRFRRKSASLSRLEIHHVRALPGNVALRVMFEDLLAPFAQQLQA